ncbi:MAG: hypothetical protein LBV68_08675 [Spirochaetaceae bacterium]|jgi:epoxyqueuosine reductase|nr:hypothetical protein [Spirochaetaceae bacterium]
MKIETNIKSEELIALALNAEFTSAATLAMEDLVNTVPSLRTSAEKIFSLLFEAKAASLLICALPYGNVQAEEISVPEAEQFGDYAIIAPFARFNYYREAVKRLQTISRELRRRFGGSKHNFKIFCNSRIPEKILASRSSLGVYGKNTLIITEEAGSLVVLAAMILPFKLTSGGSESLRRVTASSFKTFPFCTQCDPKYPPCAAACPTGALSGADGVLDLSRCIQWYASGNGKSVPDFVRKAWGRRLYGCTNCQNACPYNKQRITGIKAVEGKLDAYINAKKLLRLPDAEIKGQFKGTAMGLSWLSPELIRRNAKLALGLADPV